MKWRGTDCLWWLCWLHFKFKTFPLEHGPEQFCRQWHSRLVNVEVPAVLRVVGKYHAFFFTSAIIVTKLWLFGQPKWKNKYSSHQGYYYLCVVCINYSAQILKLHVDIVTFLLDHLLTPAICEMYKITVYYPNEIQKLKKKKMLHYFVREKQFSYYPVYVLPQPH